MSKTVAIVLALAFQHGSQLVAEDKPLWGLDKSHWQDVSFVAKCDETEQKYALLLPENFDETRHHDLFMMFHGMYGDRWQLLDLHHHGASTAIFEASRKHDLIIATPDYRIDQWMGPKGEADSLQIMVELKRKYRINKVFIGGGSMGGSAVLTLAVRHPYLFDGIFSVNGTANYLEYPNYQEYIQKGFGGTKAEVPLEYKNRSAEYWPERFIAPLGIVVGSDDTAVPPHSCARLADVLKKMNRKVMFVSRDKIGHGATYEDSRKVLDFVLDLPARKEGAGNDKNDLPAGPGGQRNLLVVGVGPGWKQLTLDDFAHVNCHEDTWSFRDGVIHSTGQPIGVTRTVNQLTNFELVVEWRHLKSAGNSGVFVWASPASIKNLEEGKGRLPEGIEIQVLDLGYAERYEKEHGKKSDWFTCHGDVFPVGSARMKPFPPLSANGSRSFPSKNLTRGVGQWNHYYVRAIDGEVRLWVNGEEVSGGTDCDPATGYICLESEGSPVEFRNLRIRELPSRW